MLGQHRTVNLAFFAFLITTFVAIATALRTEHPLTSAVGRFSEEWRRPVALLFVIGVACTGNTYVVGADLLSGRLRRYDVAMQQRYQELERCQQTPDRVCELTPLGDRPSSFVINDVSSATADWVNVAYSHYFGVSSVRAQSGNPANPNPNTDVRH